MFIIYKSNNSLEDLLSHKFGINFKIKAHRVLKFLQDKTKELEEEIPISTGVIEGEEFSIDQKWAKLDVKKFLHRTLQSQKYKHLFDKMSQLK